MAYPTVYAGPYSTQNIEGSLNNTSILSGPNWLPTLTGNIGKESPTKALKRSNGHTWYCLDLLGKYHKDSKLKQFHALTFYFRSTRSGEGAIITSMLPESFTYSIGGHYGEPIKIGGADLIKAVVQEFTGGNESLEFNVNSALIWQKPKRMDLVFRIPIIDDSESGSHINYQEAIDLFGEAILPEISRNGTYESVPGPNLTTVMTYRARNGKAVRGSKVVDATTKAVGGLFQDVVGGQQRQWDRISVQVGGMLLLDWCVIQNLKVTFPNTKAMVLHNYTGTHTAQVDDNGNETFKAHLQPIQAELEVTISTVMGLTRATFKDMLYQTESTNKGYAVDVDPPTNSQINQQKKDSLQKIMTALNGEQNMSMKPGYSFGAIQIPENNRSVIGQPFTDMYGNQWNNNPEI